MKIIIIIANFFVQSHSIEKNVHNYELLGVMNESINDSGIEHYISYSGPALPVNDKKKFYAEIKAECEEVVTIEHGRNTKRRFCTAIRISY